VKSNDLCDNCYRAYKCFWDGVKAAEADLKPNSQRFSLYKIFGFDKLEDEEEILADKAKTEDDSTKT
jgi:hypothetical protein